MDQIVKGRVSDRLYAIGQSVSGTDDTCLVRKKLYRWSGRANNLKQLFLREYNFRNRNLSFENPESKFVRNGKPKTFIDFF